MAEYCGKCQKQVYFAERVRAINKTFHKTCFICCQCRRKLDSTNCTDHNDQLYCKFCHARNFGSKGVGRGICSVLEAVDINSVPGTVIINNREVTSSNGFHMNGNNGDTHHKMTGYSSSGMQPPKRPSIGSNIEKVVGGLQQYPNHRKEAAEMCKRCGRVVYYAERAIGAGSIWHKTCFTCNDCHKSLQSTNTTDRGGEVYCKGCYDKKFAPRGFRPGTMLQTAVE